VARPPTAAVAHIRKQANTNIATAATANIVFIAILPSTAQVAHILPTPSINTHQTQKNAVGATQNLTVLPIQPQQKTRILIEKNRIWKNQSMIFH
jgi:hypothetical protein